MKNIELMEKDFQIMKENGDYEKYNPTPTEKDLEKMWEEQQ